MTESVPDQIRCSTTVASAPESVWELVASPGWWLVDVDPAQLLPSVAAAGSSHRFDNAFEVEVVDVKPYEFVAYDWAWVDGSERPRTRVDVSLVPEQSGTRVTVVESGLSHGESRELLAEHYRENEEGWREQLGLLKNAAEGRR